MKISKENLIKIIEEEFNSIMKERQPEGTEVEWQLPDLAAKIRSQIGGDAGFPVGDWGDEALNDAANSAARSLLFPSQSRQNMNKNYELPIHRFYEEKVDEPGNK